MHTKSLLIALTLLFVQSPAFSQTVTPPKTGRVEKTQQVPAQVEGPGDTHACGLGGPTVLDERYVRSGRAEKTLQLPGVLPPEAPIPDTLKTQATTTQTPEPAKPAAKPESVEAPRDTNMFQLKPTILDEEYYRSGRAEHSLQLPGVLPPGAPIPDSF